MRPVPIVRWSNPAGPRGASRNGCAAQVAPLRRTCVRTIDGSARRQGGGADHRDRLRTMGVGKAPLATIPGSALDHGRIPDMSAIDATEVNRAIAIRGDIDFARGKGKPPDGGTGTHAQAPAGIAHPGDQGRRIDRANRAGARDPGPPPADEQPASVMEGRKSPRRLVYPGPSPGFDPGPAAMAVRSPVGGYRPRVPDGSILGDAPPVSVGIEVGIARHAGGNVARGLNRRRFPIPGGCPIVQSV